MDNKEMLYEISLKYNTLKMYENTLDQMRKNGICSDDSIEKVEKEKETVEKELIELLNPNTKINETGRKSPSVCEDNKFVKELNKKAEYVSLYNRFKCDNFYDSIKKNEDEPAEEKTYSKKPTFAEVQDKISNSQWISCSNFIIEFPKDEIDIDEWRVSGFYYQNEGWNELCSSSKGIGTNGDLCVSVNDFAYKKDDGTYNILSDIILNLEKTAGKHIIGNIHAKIISNDGEELYRMVFENCRFISSDCDGFSYETTGLRKVNLRFEYDELHVLAPNEKLAPKEFV